MWPIILKMLMGKVISNMGNNEEQKKTPMIGAGLEPDFTSLYRKKQPLVENSYVTPEEAFQRKRPMV